MTRSTVDLPAPFVPSSATVSPGCDLEVDVEQHLHRPVGEVEVRDLQRRRRRAVRRALVELLLFLEELLDDEREVVADEPRAVHQQQPADDRASVPRG